MEEILYALLRQVIAQVGIEAARRLIDRSFAQASVGAAELEDCDWGAPFPEEYPECRPSYSRRP